MEHCRSAPTVTKAHALGWVVCLARIKFKGRQDRQPLRGKSASERVSERVSERERFSEVFRGFRSEPEKLPVPALKGRNYTKI